MSKHKKSRSTVRWKSDLSKYCLMNNFEKRGWIKCSESDAGGGEEEWNFYWASVYNVRALFNPENRIRLADNQLINHFPNHYELTRKDLMVKNIKRYRKECAKNYAMLSASTPPHLKASTLASLPTVEILDFLPATFNLPADYSIFVEEFRRNSGTTWIMKPAAKAQGKGIFLVNKLAQIKKWVNSKWGDQSYVVSVYLNNPLLIGGCKFDLRIYALVTSYRPLKVYVHKEGFGRFCNEKYTNDTSSMENMYVHLTNVAIQKHNDLYNRQHGGKWSLANMKLYVEGTYGVERARSLFHRMDMIILHSLKAVQKVLINDKHCFECYGYDLLIDDQLKPWLVEVNASPSLSASTISDRRMKDRIMDDILKVVSGSTHWPSPLGSNGCKERVVGGFELLYDEAAEMAEKASANNKKNPRRNMKLWR